MSNCLIENIVLTSDIIVVDVDRIVCPMLVSCCCCCCCITVVDVCACDGVCGMMVKRNVTKMMM